MKIAPIVDALKAVRMRGCRLHDSPPLPAFGHPLSLAGEGTGEREN
jgi:hypothetical protein